MFGNVSFGTNNGHPRARFPAAPPPRSGMGEARGGAPAARGDSLAALAADAARGLASCRARAAALRARLDGSLRASGLEGGDGVIASQHAALTRRAAGLAGDVSGEARDAVDACEAHLKRGETGGALAAYARLARAALLRDASSGPARLDGAVAIRAERCRAALSERLAASLDQCDARGPDENAAERTALALGGLYWLDRDPDEWFRRDDRSAAPIPEGGWRGVDRVAAKKTRLDRLARRDAETPPAAAFLSPKQQKNERATSEAKGPSGPSLEAPHPSANLEEEEEDPRVLEEDSPSSAFSAAASLRRDLDAAARDAASLLAALDAAPAPAPPPETVRASVAAPAAAALGAAIDALIARIDRDGGFEATMGPFDRADRRRVDDADARADATDARRASGALVALARAADEYVANAAAGLAATPDSKRGSLRRTNPTSTPFSSSNRREFSSSTRAAAASLVSASFSATLDARLARLESALARSRAAAPALRALAAAGPSALAERFLRAGALEPHHKLEPACAVAVAEANHALPTETTNTARFSVGRRTSPRKSMSIPPLEPRVRSVVARALAARVGALVADALGAAFGREAMTRRAACVAANTARAAARAIRRAEAEEGEAEEGEAVADERTRRTKTALATARRLEALASRADSAAASAASRPAATALEGGAAQAWRFRRKPDSIATAPRCSPAIVHWRRCVARGVLALDREAAAFQTSRGRFKGSGEGGGSFSDGFGSARARLLDAFASTAAAEAAATTLRIAPSRARRDAFAWDCRAIASTLAALDRVVRDAVLRDEDEDEDERGEGEDERGEDEDERGEARTRSDEARRTVGSSRVLAATSRALVRRAALLLAPADDVRAALPEIARLAVSGATLAPGDDDRGVGSFGSFDEERAAHLSTLAESAFGRAPSPESLWDPRDPAWDRPPPSDEWAWIPRDDPARTAASLLDGDRVAGDGDERLSKTPTHSAPWPCPREAREAHEALERSWREAEAAQAARASAEERWAALEARSELADDDQTPLDEEEEAERKALRDAVAAAAAARAGGGGGETRRPAGAMKKPSASSSGP